MSSNLLVQRIDNKINNINSKILLLFHSGSGSTQNIAQILKRKLSKFDVNLLAVTVNTDPKIIKNYDLLIIGFPTYHCEPSTTMREFINRISNFDIKKCYIFTTYGLYHGNSLRIAIKRLAQKKIICQDFAAFRGPTSDGALLYPSLKFMFRYGRNVVTKMKKFIININKNVERDKPKIPLWRIYVPINEILKLIAIPSYNKYIRKIFVEYDTCTNCNTCVHNCPRECWRNENKRVIFNNKNCELCLKCVHNCPVNAINFKKGMKNKPRLDKRFYKGLQNDFFIE